MKLIFKIYKRVRCLKREDAKLRKSIQDHRHEIDMLRSQYHSECISSSQQSYFSSRSDVLRFYESELNKRKEELDQREKKINEMQQKLNDQILKLGIVKGVNK